MKPSSGHLEVTLGDYYVFLGGMQRMSKDLIQGPTNCVAQMFKDQITKKAEENRLADLNVDLFSQDTCFILPDNEQIRIGLRRPYYHILHRQDLETGTWMGESILNVQAVARLALQHLDT